MIRVVLPSFSFKLWLQTCSFVAQCVTVNKNINKYCTTILYNISMSAILGGTCRNPLCFIYSTFICKYIDPIIYNLPILAIYLRNTLKETISQSHMWQTLCSLFHNKGKWIHFLNELGNCSCLVYHFLQF